jgi:serine protease Do
MKRQSLMLAFGISLLLAVPGLVQAEVPATVLDAEMERIAVVRRASASTLAVFGPHGGGGGSGVLISPDGYALTNFHVAAPSGTAMKCGLNDGRLYDAVIVGVDPTGDVALIKLFGRNDFPVAEMGDSDKVRAGDWVYVIGNPFLLATDFMPSVSYGIISGVHRYQYPSGTLLEYTDCLQTDAAINPGNSGGPLFNGRGELIGINGRGSFEKRGRVNVGVGYAISINQIKNFLGYLRSGRIVDHATLGAIVASDDEGHVVVSNILEDTDAYRRGLRLDDEIVKLAGRPIRTVNGLKNVLGTLPRLWRVPLVYRRDGEVYRVPVRLGGVHSAGELAAKLADKSAPPPRHPDGDPPQEDPKRPPRPKFSNKSSDPRKKMPAIIKQHYEQKKGYANHYYNRLHRARLADAVHRAAGVDRQTNLWILRGEIHSEWGAGEMRVELGPQTGLAELPDYQGRANFTGELGDMLDPPATGGLLVALHLWQRLLLYGVEDFGNVEYIGTVPLVDGIERVDGAQRVDLLIGLYAGVEARFMFDPENGQLLALEMFSDDAVDPCEIYFGDYREVDGLQLPHRMQIQHALRSYGVFRISEFEFEAAEKE